MSQNPQNIQSVLNETRSFVPSLKATSSVPDMATYEALCAEAVRDEQGFWARLGRENLDWHKPFTQTLDESNAPFYRWYGDGLLNASYNCLDRHVLAGRGDVTAIISESDSGVVTRVTYAELLARVCQMANVLKSLGVQKSDRVIIYMPMSIEGIVAMQACARIGATHSVVFGGFSAKAIHERVIDAGAVLIITADAQTRGGKQLGLKLVVDEALALGGCDTVRHVLVNQRTEQGCDMVVGRDLALEPLLAQQSTDCVPEWVDAEHPLFVLYTSGSTGTPKGVQHSTGGYLMWATQTMKWSFDITAQDVFWCTADIGWITGHTYVCYGPLSCGATQLVFEGIPTYPDASRFWQMIERHRCSIFYTAPTAIRSLIKAADMDEQVHPKKYDLSSLRILGTVGEPINPEAWMWYHKQVGGERCPIMDTFWQTETGGHVITPLPAATPLTPGSCTLPLPGIQAAIVDETGEDVENGQGGLLVIKRPWPSMIRTIWNNPERFKAGYYPEELGGRYYLAGDGAVRHSDTTYFQIMGRIDDVLNVSGHRLGTMEIESALVAHPMVAEAAVVGKPDEVSGEAICAFVVLKSAIPEGEAAVKLANELREWVKHEIGPIAKPKDIRFGDNLPKTRSGKIMRRLLRSIAKDEAITQDTSTLENPAILDQLRTSVV
ncbi:acetyl-coenzyme A synthetase [Formosimonas limnophila]|uniref:Acetate--CoA ligase n=1 Tax=Formosimonas limnophila TaxID=1384487 RepID=A0A8J3G070_9BURK|nr:acetate--CoA ligase [Formosimonas limnophila]GHA70082.1 acetyl-coenzyme A synthetase [Formosimonas limnophila]